ncbi:hypothetical protein Zmor_011359 [Zophobas morio]|uniref:Peptidase S1 domain-containing protein n=1 Tax=Zophobas morio TaxID=2755281 RepID=A0AA38IV13_9CUCU|nr:hypothetical protein Zmor_011359 [Zophobas morio]
MFLVLVLISLLSCSSGTPTVSNCRIVGGQDILIEEVPYQISLQYNNSHYCGGTIIAPNYILTTAHCVEGTLEYPWSIRAGTSIREDGGQVITVRTLTMHPLYNRDNGSPDYDIAVLELTANLKLGFQVAVISLPSENQTWPAGTDALISGWGLTENSTKALNLQGATVQLINRNSCVAVYGYFVTDRMFCAGVDGGGIDACDADSGGALQIEGILVGLISFGVGCGRPDYPGVYTNVSVLLDFIQDVTGL